MKRNEPVKRVVNKAKIHQPQSFKPMLCQIEYRGGIHGLGIDYTVNDDNWANAVVSDLVACVDKYGEDMRFIES
jgi:hypothetical protein